jgi:phosphate-selective porin OprO/OprP
MAPGRGSFFRLGKNPAKAAASDSDELVSTSRTARVGPGKDVHPRKEFNMLKHMLGRFQRWATAGALLAVCATNSARSDEPVDPTIQDIRARIEAMEKKNAALLEQLQSQPGTPTADGAAPPADDAAVQKHVEDYLKALDDKAKQDAEQKKLREKCEGYEVGTDVGNLRVFWNFDHGVTYASPHNDFIFHIGGFFQFDSVWWNQPSRLQPATQEGRLEDGVYFRRIAVSMNGVAWDNVEWNLNYAFDSFGGPTGNAFPAANPNGSQVFNRNPAITGLQDCWVGVADMPWIGSVRIGQIRIPQGIEADLVSNPRDFTFMERASFTDAFYNNFGAGIWFGDHILCDRATWAFMAYRQEGQSQKAGGSLQQGFTDGAVFGDDNWAYTGRLTCLPIYENEGRCLVHLGTSLTYKDALPNTIAPPVTSAKFVDFAARPEMRDTNGGYANVGPGNGNAFVDTGLIQCNDAIVVGFEYLNILGPLTVQSEAALAYAEDAVAVTPPGGARLAFPTQTLGFWGGYMQVAYLLTGEHRLYDRRLGALRVNGVRPYTPFFFKRSREGGICSGLGALELALRYSYLNLNDGPVQGGILGSTSVGINWYLNTNLKIQFVYLNSNRWDIGATTVATPGNISGAVNSFGIRTQIQF